MFPKGSAINESSAVRHGRRQHRHGDGRRTAVAAARSTFPIKTLLLLYCKQKFHTT